ncbi:acyl--CoA ligase [Plantactinospora sp. S1510]|uniref:Acyl--CoA ligase n=1 Tax=Plantactinospora alkalitolerans TaxID=2789879 RepID=A0ABS0GV77_9ACTN|nr:acyl--CoA ligase [Plantactinospora alkalitolerans]
MATDDGDRITYAALVDHADRIGHALRGAGPPDELRVSTDLRAGPQFFALALAALKFGFGLFPMNAGHLDPDVTVRMRREANTTLHINDGRDGSSGDGRAYDDLVTGRVRSLARPAARAGHLIFATSGTTGEPTIVDQPRPHHPYKGVAVFDRYSAGRGFGPHVMGNPTYHLGTLGPALYALQAGSGVVVAHGWSAGGFDILVRRHSAASAFLSVDLLTDYVSSQRRGSGLATLFHGGSACPPWVKRKALDVHGPILHEYYGTSEGVISEISSVEWLAYPGSVGRPIAGVQVVVQRDGAPVRAGSIGEVAVIPRGAAREGGTVDHQARGTGDLGYVNQEGYLHVIGRMTRTGGTAEAVVEHRVRSIPGARDVIAIEESGLTCLVEAEHGEPAEWAAWVALVADDVGARLRGVTVLQPGTLERTSTGKINRVAARKAIVSGGSRTSAGLSTALAGQRAGKSGVAGCEVGNGR